MAPRNTRVSPDGDVRSPARSFVRTLDTFYGQARDTRSEQAFQQGVGRLTGLFEEQAAQMKQQERASELQQGVADAMREEAGEELRGVKTGKLFRQHSKYYMMGLNETRGKAAATAWKQKMALAYQEWDGRHTDDDGSAYREWMNSNIADFMGSLGDDTFKQSGALPIINEVAANLASQHTGFTAQRLETESFEAYSEIISGVFDDLHQGVYDKDDGNKDWGRVIDALAEEADDMYATDGAEANNHLVTTAIRYANANNDPDPIFALAKANDSGKIKLSVLNEERLADAIDAVEADIERVTSKQNAQIAADEKARRDALLNDWGMKLQEDPHADLPDYGAVGDPSTFTAMVRLKDTFTRAATAENPQISNQERLQFEAELFAASTPKQKMQILTEFSQSNPTALSGADVGRYSREIMESTNPGSLVNNQLVGKFRDGFAKSLAEFQLGDGFDLNTSSFLRTRGEIEFNTYLMAKAGSVDMNDPAAINAVIKEAQAYAMEQLAFDFPEVLREKNTESPLGPSLGVGEALETRDAVIAEEAAKEFEEMVDGGKGGDDTTEPEEEGAGLQNSLSPSGEAPEPVDIEEQPEPFEDPNVEGEYDEVRSGFYGELIQRFTDGEDTRKQRVIDSAADIMTEDAEFASAVTSLADELNIPMGAILAVMDFETGGTFSTNIRNAAGSGATGLIQFMPKTARSLGTTVEQLARMTRGQQMVYVRKYFKQFPQIKGGSVDDVYMSVLWPKAIGKPPGYPIFRKGTKAYTQNAGLDTNKDGTVTKFEAAAKVRQRFYE